MIKKIYFEKLVKQITFQSDNILELENIVTILIEEKVKN